MRPNAKQSKSHASSRLHIDIGGLAAIRPTAKRVPSKLARNLLAALARQHELCQQCWHESCWPPPAKGSKLRANRQLARLAQLVPASQPTCVAWRSRLPGYAHLGVCVVGEWDPPVQTAPKK